MADKLKKKIAILDDEPYVCDFLSKLLASSGYETFTATDGQHGLNLINREHPDLIILDLIMPGLSGYALLDILNAKGSRIPVLVMSSMSNISDNLAHQGIAGLLIKPIDEERLLIHVDCIFKLEDAAKYEGTIAGTKTSEEETGAEESEPSSEKTKSEAKAADLDATEEAEPSPAEALPETETPGTPAGEEAPLVLIVEDEPDMQMILSRLLEHHGFRVEVAGDGPLGLEMAQKL